MEPQAAAGGFLFDTVLAAPSSAGTVFLLAFLTVLFWDSHRLLVLGPATTVAAGRRHLPHPRGDLRSALGRGCCRQLWPRSPRTAKPLRPKE